MNILERITIVLLRFIKQLNLFNTDSTDDRQRLREIFSTRIYIVLLPTILTILIIYSAQKDLYYTVQVSNPSIDTYQKLLDDYSNILVCPCSQISVPYSTFLTLTPIFHPICSSDFVSDRWLAYLYHEDASSYLPFDMKSVGNAQFQLLRTLCESSKQAIVNAFKVIFTSSTFINSRGLLSNSESVHVQAEAFADDFIRNIGRDQQRRRALVATFFDRNFVVSGLETSAVPVIDSAFKLNMKIVQYTQFYAQHEVIVGLLCTCGKTYACETPLSICDNLTYELDSKGLFDQYLKSINCQFPVNGFRSGCLPLNSLLLSTLECYNNQNCLDTITFHLGTANTSFNILNGSIFSTTLISALANELMVEKWSTQINYSGYFVTCRPLSCSYVSTDLFIRIFFFLFSFLFIITL
jgi:hypothetical protein